MDALLIALGIRGIRSRRRERAMQARIANLEAWQRYDHPVQIHYPLPPMPPVRTRPPSRNAGALVVVLVVLIAFAITALANAAGR